MACSNRENIFWRWDVAKISSNFVANKMSFSWFDLAFFFKFLLAQYDHRSQTGHIQKIVVSTSEWNPSVLQLLIDLCQINGIDFKMSHWLDLIHVCQFTSMNLFFSESVKQDVFKLNHQLIPTLDPLTCYSLYQEWEHWFNKLYDYWR